MKSGNKFTLELVRACVQSGEGAAEHSPRQRIKLISNQIAYRSLNNFTI